MRLQHGRDDLSLICCFRSHHDDEPSSAQITHVMCERCGLCIDPRDVYERALEARKEPVASTGRIQALQAGLSVQDIDVVRVNASPKERFDGRFSIVRIGYRACNAVDWVMDEGFVGG
jgi:hypothetical protein